MKFTQRSKGGVWRGLYRKDGKDAGLGMRNIHLLRAFAIPQILRATGNNYELVRNICGWDSQEMQKYIGGMESDKQELASNFSFTPVDVDISREMEVLVNQLKAFTDDDLKKELQDERKRNEEAEKERYFFKLHDDFRDALIASRERDMESPNAFANDQTKGIVRAVKDATSHAHECLLAAEAACNDKTERLQHFVNGFSARNFLGHYEFSLTFRKFLVAYSYLSDIMKDSPPGAYKLHHEILMSTMGENEMKLISLFWINYNSNKKEPKPFEDVFVFISMYCFDILGKFGLLKDQMLAVSVLTNADPIIDEVTDLRLLCGMGKD